MLAKPPLYLPKHIFVPQTSASLRNNITCSKPRLSVRAGYTREPTGTPGAYHLVNSKTGKKVIVWGGVENDEAPIPSKESLSWEPRERDYNSEMLSIGTEEGFKDSNAAGAQPTEVDSDSDASTPKRGKLAPQFGRLKVPRIRALIKRFPGVKQENTNDYRPHYGTGDMLSDALSSDSEDEYEGKKVNLTSYGQKGTPLRTRNKLIGKEGIWSGGMTPRTAVYDHDNFESLKPNKRHSERAELIASGPRTSSSLTGWNNASYRQRPVLDSLDTFKRRKKKGSDDGFFSRKKFEEVGCSDDMIKSLTAQDIHGPSHIQAMAYRHVLEGKSCLLADQSGSGKTLAYLAPVIQHLRQEEVQGFSKPASESPRMVILVPTAELASQVLNACRSISRFGVPFRSMVATGGFKQKTQLDNLREDLDVLIATPGRFIYLVHEGYLQLSNLKCAVLDEVDILFGDDEFGQVMEILLKTAPVTTQYLLVTATLPGEIYNKLVEVFPDCEVIMGPGMHRTSSNLEEMLVDCSGRDGEEKTPETAFLNKKAALLQLVEENPVPKTIIFCNKIETCRKVENVLKRLDRNETYLRTLPFHAAVAKEVRRANMKEFLKSQCNDLLFLICTDRASRGIDFQNVDHVILFDFPRDPSEYVRRVGRTARGAGGKGKAFVFVVGKQVSLARRIMERNQKGHPVHDVPLAYEHTLAYGR